MDKTLKKNRVERDKLRKVMHHKKHLEGVKDFPADTGDED